MPGPEDHLLLCPSIFPAELCSVGPLFLFMVSPFLFLDCEATALLQSPFSSPDFCQLFEEECIKAGVYVSAATAIVPEWRREGLCIICQVREI